MVAILCILRVSGVKATTGGKMLHLGPQVVALIISLPRHFCLSLYHWGPPLVALNYCHSCLAI